MSDEFLRKNFVILSLLSCLCESMPV
jgi:hypothetical protein